jgi:serine/threonine-protein kinase
MATVFLAEDGRLGREVAIKRLHIDAPEASLRRFRREAHLGAALSHPNFVAIHDTIAGEDGALIVMEYVPGSSLAELAGGRRLAPQRAVPILRAVAEALDHAHAEGVVHRDVKPANVLVRDDGIVKLADLGIARAIGATQITSEGSVIGTLPYMAPERLEGPGAGGPESDVYALAAVAYEILSGQPPRETTSNEQADSHGPPDLRGRWPDAPPGAVAVLERGMDPDPARRQPSAGGLVDELEAVLAGGTRAATEQSAAPMAAVPFPEPPGTRERPIRRRPTLVRETATGTAGQGPGRVKRGAALATLGLAIAAVAAIALASGGDGGDGGGGEGPSAAVGDRAGAKPDGAGQQPAEQAPAPAPADEPASSDDGSGGFASADPAELNDLGFSLIGEGRYEEAIPVLQRAVQGAEGSDGLTYAYALFNLGHALRLAGRPEEAIPVLEQRLAIPNQTGTVARELAAARAAAGEGGDEEGFGGPGNGNGNAFGHEKHEEE